MSCRPPPEHGPSGGSPTERQKEALAFAYVFKLTHGYAPSIRDFCVRFGWKSTNAVAEKLSRLEQLRLMSRPKGLARAMLFTASGEALALAYLHEHPEVLHG